MVIAIVLFNVFLRMAHECGIMGMLLIFCMSSTVPTTPANIIIFFFQENNFVEWHEVKTCDSILCIIEIIGGQL